MVLKLASSVSLLLLGSDCRRHRRVLFLDFPSCLFLGHGDAGDEVVEPLAVLLRCEGRYLRPIARKALPKVFQLLDDTVLPELSAKHQQE